jgi:broad specificity phosphatase PhoE
MSTRPAGAAVTLYLVRHAETANPRDILYGRLPRFNLSPRGREQAAATAEVLATLPLDAIYQSPLLRARTTAAVIAARHPGVPLHRSSLLVENLHPYQGRPQSEVAKLGDRAYDSDVLAGQGESIADLRDRMARFLQMVRRRHPGGTVAVITHADPLAALRLHLLGLELTHANLRKEAHSRRSSEPTSMSWARPDWSGSGNRSRPRRPSKTRGRASRMRRFKRPVRPRPRPRLHQTAPYEYD